MVRNFTLKYNLYWPDNHGRNEGCKGVTIPRASSHWGGEKSQQCRSAFCNTVYLLPKDLRFEHGGAKLVPCPGRQLTSVTCWQQHMFGCSANIIAQALVRDLILRHWKDYRGFLDPFGVGHFLCWGRLIAFSEKF